LRIPDEEWRGKDTSLAHLKVFGCDSFVKVKDVCEEAMKCTFIANSSSLTKPIQKSQVVLVDIPENLVENDSIVVEHGLSLEITQSLDSRASVRYSSSANYLLLTENGEPKFYSEALSSKESVQWKKAINEEMVPLERNQMCSLFRLPSGKKASQRLWMFKVKEELNSSEWYEAPLSIIAAGAFLCGSLE
ncbi:retrovirus-related pol polyprotein from transposon TNT 1-94, partial [Tanacetum coccineum]